MVLKSNSSELKLKENLIKKIIKFYLNIALIIYQLIKNY